MVAYGWTLAALSAAATAVSAVTTVDPIVIKGSKFFYKTNGTQFYMRGLAYQQDAGAAGAVSTNTVYSDPLADSAGCSRDIPYLLKLRTNSIRVYAIDPTQNHDDCMSMLADAGIYVIADLSSPNQSIISTQPSWNVDLYNRYASVIDTMAQYTNTIGFYAGNEVVHNTTVSPAAPYVKAAVRDMKAYIKQKNYRPMGIGYAADDDTGIRGPMTDYLNCGSQEDDIDFFGYNVYSWCGESNINSSHYLARTQEYSNYSVPVFFAEYGCNQDGPRTFDDTVALFGSQMNDVWSGGYVFEYFEAPNDFGLVSLVDNSVSTMTGFNVYSTQIAKVSPTGVNSASYQVTNTELRDCPSMTSGWAAATALPPTPNDQLCECMVKNLTCTLKASTNSNAYAELFAAACSGNGACDGIASNGSTGTYGDYSMCQPDQQLAWAFNTYYFNHNNGDGNACDFAGNATKQSPSVASSCSNILSQAGAAGTGQVTSQPTGHGAAGPAASSSSSAAHAVSVPSIDMRVLSLGAYVTLAAIAGAGIILL